VSSPSSRLPAVEWAEVVVGGGAAATARNDETIELGSAWQENDLRV